MIPKNIYITHETYEYLFKFEKQIIRTSLNNPGYKVIFYNAEKRIIFIKKYYPEFYFYYNFIDNRYGAMKADIFRILILYHYGGIYLDIKSILNNINEIFKKYPNKDFYTTSFKDDKLIEVVTKICKSKYMNCFIATKSKGIVITKLKDIMLSRLKYHFENNNDKYFMRGLPIVFYLTGPLLFTKVVNDNLDIIVDISLQDKEYIIYYPDPDNSNITILKRLYKDKKYYKKSYHFSRNKIFNKLKN
tara:strand:- start:66 stop:803 length:738 start_codon:yes stop_codon:yes gene_type:complete